MKTAFKAGRVAWVALALLACLPLSGCGGAKKGTLHGKVSYKGQAVTGGNIKLIPASGGTEYPIPIKPDGTYDVSDVPLGSMNVAIETESVKGMGNPGYKMPGGGALPAGTKPPEVDNSNAPKYVAIPGKYAHPKSSGLTVEITKGRVEKDFDLTD